MDAPLCSQKKRGIMIVLPLLAIWIMGMWICWKKGGSIVTDTVLMAWYFFLAFLLLELLFIGTGSRIGIWLAVLSLLWGVRAGLMGSRPLTELFMVLDRIGSTYVEYLSPILTLLLVLPICLSWKKERPDCSWRSALFGIVLAASSCILEPVRFTISLCLLAFVLYSTSQEIAKIREEKLCALDEAELLTELNRLKNQSYSELSHEMKTPLTVISVNAQLAAMNLETGTPDEETITDIKIISAEASRLTQMVASLSGLGQLQGSGIGYNRLSLDALVKTTARSCQILAARHGNILTVDSEPNMPLVFGNADHLTQVLMNLISNANRHTRNGSIIIGVKTRADWVEVSVTDNGEGIDPELLPHVFERFCRGKRGDTGLGLLSVKRSSMAMAARWGLKVSF